MQRFTFSAKTTIVVIFIFLVYQRKQSLTFTLALVESKFIAGNICKMEKRLKYGFSWTPFEDGTFTNKFRCLSKCGLDSNCIGASMDGNNVCFFHGLSPPDLNCLTELDHNHRYWGKYCVQGSWKSSINSCVCHQAASGEECTQYPPTCYNLIPAGYPHGKYYNVTIGPFNNGARPIKATCFVKPDTKTNYVIALENNGRSENYNRTWYEFVNGFYIDNDNYWIGLEPLRMLLNSQQCNGKTTSINVNYNSYPAIDYVYKGLGLSDSSNSYRLSYSNKLYGNTATVPGATRLGDCFGPHVNTPFSTWDNDNDNDVSNNCATDAGNGWWFDGCATSCNLFGGGFDSWATTPGAEKMSLPEVNMDIAHSHINSISIHVVC